MTQPSDNVYVSITFGNIPRLKAEEIVEKAQEIAGDHDVSVDYGSPIGSDDPTPIADEAADAVDPSTPTAPVSDTPTSAPTN